MVARCTWTRDYNIVWVAGELMTDAKTYRLPQEVPTGRSVDISLDMTAPGTIGSVSIVLDAAKRGWILFWNWSFWEIPILDQN